MSAAAITVRRGRVKPPGKLLEALLARREGRSVLQWLEAVFAAWRRKLKQRAASRGR